MIKIYIRRIYNYVYMTYTSFQIYIDIRNFNIIHVTIINKSNVTPCSNNTSVLLYDYKTNSCTLS